MYENIYQVKFQGGAFSDETIFPIFQNNKERISIIYGKNGAGKSTFSKAVLKAAGKDIPDIRSSVLLDNNGNPALAHAPNDYSIYVFNEQYIQDNIRIKEDGLDSIVMFGEQVDLDNQIEKALEIKNELEAESEKENKILEQYTDSNLVTSPRYYIRRMNIALSGDSNWAGRVRVIDKNRRRNASVNDNTYKDIISVIPEKSYDEVKKEYELKLSQLRQAEEDGGKINQEIKVDGRDFDMLDERMMIDLLAKKIEKPELSEREEYLLSLISLGNNELLNQMKIFFEKSSDELCPFCRQPVQKDYKLSMSESIKKILSKVVEEHKIALKSIMMEETSFDITPFVKLNSDLIDDCKAQLIIVNNIIKSTNELLKEKIDNPYKVIIVKELGLEVAVKRLIELLSELESARVEYNRPFENIPKLKSSLNKLNNELAYYEIIDLYNSFLEQEKKFKQQGKKVKEIESSLIESIEVIKGLSEKKKSINIAVDLINSSLRYVFFSRNRLEIKVEQDRYSLISNGIPVHPKDVSQGERNIIALCYFFTEILNRKEAINAYADEMFLVIDDPVSSFDRDNKIGIMSFLRDKINTIALANKNSKFVILSHDIQTIFDFEKIGQEVQKSALKKYHTKIWTYRISEIYQKHLIDFKYKNRHEYTAMIKEVYDFAVNGSDEYIHSIGNTLRKVLEAFSTFNFKMGIDEISYNENILSMLNDECYKNYFKNLMYRLILNGESHMEERAKGGDDTDFCEMYSKEEKQKTARDILSFLYLINSTHVKAHLDDINGSTKQIQEWCDEIKELNL